MTTTRLTLAAPCCALGAPPVSSAEAESIAPMFKALGDPARLRLVSLIAAQPEACVCDLVAAITRVSGKPAGVEAGPADWTAGSSRVGNVAKIRDSLGFVATTSCWCCCNCHWCCG